MSIPDKIDINNTPKHIAIIMDGNGRWAQQQGHNRLFGHNFGVESVREVLKAAQKANIEYLTLYAFSTENWNRPKEEVNGLMDLLIRTIGNEVEELHKSNVKIITIGDTEGLPASCEKELINAYEKTKNNTGVNLILALNYSSRWELTNAAKNIALKVELGNIKASEINEKSIISELSTSNIPDPELLIRTGGESRVSNFLLWQIAYTELHFTNILWPDFKAQDLYGAIIDYQSRERRFGKLSEQIDKNS
jgi:undecaprenyl diphosphate synthase